MRNPGVSGAHHRARDARGSARGIVLVIAAATLLWCFALQHPTVERSRFGDSISGQSLPARQVGHVTGPSEEIVVRATRPVRTGDAGFVALGVGLAALAYVFVGLQQLHTRSFAFESTFATRRGPPPHLSIVR